LRKKYYVNYTAHDGSFVSYGTDNNLFSLVGAVYYH